MNSPERIEQGDNAAISNAAIGNEIFVDVVAPMKLTLDSNLDLFLQRFRLYILADGRPHRSRALLLIQCLADEVLQRVARRFNLDQDPQDFDYDELVAQLKHIFCAP